MHSLVSFGLSDGSRFANVYNVGRQLKTKNEGRQNIKPFRVGWCGQQSFRFILLFCCYGLSCQVSFCSCFF